ncbi:MAG: hypothetical protein HC816_21820 [Leptolyngbyaceae cyanobacterium RM1_1_2]|nr:hypothetical protein [Leptolyngbyaceae cyanobacterium RM1_1_2]
MGWPFNKDKMGVTARNYVLENLKEGVTPEILDDWGDYEEDHRRTGCDTREETELFYEKREYTIKETD